MTGECLNCGTKVSNAYCERCGQKTSTHRFSMKHVFSHDFIHGVFHLDRGFFYTVKELMTRPGHSIREYIQGKRAKHFNYFTLILLVLTIGVILGELHPVEMTDIYESVRKNKEFSNLIDKAQEHPKLLVLVTIPLYTLFCWLLFRRARLNFAEHLVLNSYRGAGELIILLLFSVIMIFVHDLEALRSINIVFSFLTTIYSTIVYYQFFSAYGYQRRGRLFFRSLLTALSLNLLVMIITIGYLISKGGHEGQ